VSDSSRSAAPITLFTGQWADLTLEEVATLAQDFGYDGLEIACSAQHLDVRRAAEDPVYLRGQLETLERHELNLEPFERSSGLRRPHRLSSPGDRGKPGMG
jgi:sugar phosphate isomerase/epimerase